jgi:hypothetical protein
LEEHPSTACKKKMEIEAETQTEGDQLEKKNFVKFSVATEDTLHLPSNLKGKTDDYISIVDEENLFWMWDVDFRFQIPKSSVGNQNYCRIIH